MIRRYVKGKLKRLLGSARFQHWAQTRLDLQISHQGQPTALRGLKDIPADELASLVKHMADTGLASEECLAKDCLAMQVHFYSPIPDLKDLEERKVWDRMSDLAGIDFDPEAQVEFMLKLGAEYGAECDWGPDSTGDPIAFYTENNSFCFGCGGSTHLMVRHYKPKRLIEVGSGFSSRVMSAAMVKNREETGQAGEYTIIDPYPGEVVRNGLPGVTDLKDMRVELAPLEVFEKLEAGDILFIDSGHCVRMGGDVNYLLLDVLPRLAPGVVVHFHDIPMPHEYTKSLATTPTFRMFWTESYLLQAFLSMNPHYEVKMAVSYLMFDRAEEFKKAFCHYDPKVHKNISGSFWIRRK